MQKIYIFPGHAAFVANLRGHAKELSLLKRDLQIYC